MKTGIKFKACNVGSAEQHNQRDQKYCDAVEKKYGRTYFWDDHRHLNRHWKNPSYADSLPDILEEMKARYTEMDKQGRAMPLKEVEYIDKKTGKKKTRQGCNPMREGCPPIKPDTTIEDFKPFVEWMESKGLHVISIDLHHDEGHADDVTGELIANHHAHIIVDWFDRSTGKTVKIDKEDCKEMQTVLANSLGMERGTPKEDTGLQGLGAVEYKEMMAKKHTAELETRSAALTEQLADKEERVEELRQQETELSEISLTKTAKSVGKKILSHLGLTKDDIETAREDGREQGVAEAIDAIKKASGLSFNTTTPQGVGRVMRKLWEEKEAEKKSANDRIEAAKKKMADTLNAAKAQGWNDAVAMKNQEAAQLNAELKKLRPLKDQISKMEAEVKSLRSVVNSLWSVVKMVAKEWYDTAISGFVRISTTFGAKNFTQSEAQATNCVCGMFGDGEGRAWAAEKLIEDGRAAAKEHPKYQDGWARFADRAVQRIAEGNIGQYQSMRR